MKDIKSREIIIKFKEVDDKFKVDFEMKQIEIRELTSLFVDLINKIDKDFTGFKANLRHHL